jgi:hypothetical protein
LQERDVQCPQVLLDLQHPVPKLRIEHIPVQPEHPLDPLLDPPELLELLELEPLGVMQSLPTHI